MKASRNIYLDSELSELVDKEAVRLGLSFSAFVRLLFSQYFDGIKFERKEQKHGEDNTASVTRQHPNQ